MSPDTMSPDTWRDTLLATVREGARRDAEVSAALQQLAKLIETSDHECQSLQAAIVARMELDAAQAVAATVERARLQNTVGTVMRHPAIHLILMALAALVAGYMGMSFSEVPDVIYPVPVSAAPLHTPPARIQP